MEALDGLWNAGLGLSNRSVWLDGVSAAGRRLEQAKQGVRRRVHLVGVIAVPFSREVSMPSDVSGKVSKAHYSIVCTRDQNTYPPLPMMVTCRGSCWLGSLSCYGVPCWRCVVVNLRWSRSYV